MLFLSLSVSSLYLYYYHNFIPFLACKTSPILTHTATAQHTPTIHLYLTGPIPSHRVLPWIEVDVGDHIRKTSCAGKIDVNEAEHLKLLLLLQGV